MSARPFSAVTFDAGSTLLYCDPTPQELYAEALSRHGRSVRADDVGPIFTAAWTEMQRRTRPGQDRYSSVCGGERAWWGAFLREVLERLDHDAPWQELLDDLYAAFARADVWRLFPEVVTTLEALRAHSLRLAVISNWDTRLPDILRHLELDRYFAEVTVSSIEGVEKPDPEIFRCTVERLGVAAEETLHVGDSPREDCHGAAAAGLTPVLLDRSDLFAGQPYRRISTLDELLGLVG